MNAKSPLERALLLAAVSGLKATFGPAMIAASQNRQEKKTLVLAALGEMVVDKLPFVPNRSSLPLLLPRAFAGYWSAKKSLEGDNINDPAAAALGAAVAMGVAVVAPFLRNSLSTILGIPNATLGLAEDFVALRVGSDAAGLTMDDLKTLGIEAFSDMQEGMTTLIEEGKKQLEHAV